MPGYTILNFEDKIGSGLTAAASEKSINGITRRYEERKQNTGLKKKFIGSNTVTEYRCVNEKPVGFTKDKLRIDEIRTACMQAKKIYAMMHGDPRQTDKCFTNTGNSFGVVDLATSEQMAKFLSSVIRGSSSKTKIALIMCYGARCTRYKSAEVNHMSMIDEDDLASSFAYRLFYHLVDKHGYKGQLTAVTGKISHEATGRAKIEQEDMIDLNMDVAEANRLVRESKKPAVGGTLLPQNMQDQTYKDNYNAWKDTADAKELLRNANEARKAKGAKMSELKSDGTQEKYGKFLYCIKMGKLKIASKYGDPNNPTGMKPGTLLYSGPLMNPT
ncbi:MAG: hypothetical protein ACYSTS_00515 [Planctomycetota bacterium]|jgi:hypothetical protein